MSLVFLGLIVAAFGQVEHGKGWLQGTVVGPKGEPAREMPDGKGALLTLKPAKGKVISTRSDVDKRGFYVFENIPYGIYELSVGRTYVKENGKWNQFRPQRIYGVKVRPSRVTRLFVTVHPGKALEEMGKPRQPVKR